MENKVDIQHNKIFHLEDSVVMYGVYNSDTLEELIKAVHKLLNTATWNERLFVGQIKDWYNWYLTTKGVNHYAINSILFLMRVREKCVKMYERFLNQLKTICTSNKSIVKRLFTYLTLTTFQIEHNIKEGKACSTD